MHGISLKAEELFVIGGFAVTNALVLSFIVFVLLGIAAWWLKDRFHLVPGPVQNIIEFGVEKLLGLMDAILGSRKNSEKYFPLVATIFIFILTANWLGILPGVGSLIVNEENHKVVPLLRYPASDINFTLALGIISVVMTNIFGIKVLGLKRHLAKFFNFKNPLTFFIGILELISEFAKVISFSFRLFGNIFAGEVLLVIIFFLAPYAAPVPFLFLEIFVGFIQAFVFAMLTLVFIALHTAQTESH